MGWATHYASDVAFATLLLAIKGSSWALPDLAAVVVGVFTVLAPLCVMQPSMGAGFASSKTSTPLKNCLCSLANHTVFGVSLYLTAELLAAITPTI